MINVLIVEDNADKSTKVAGLIKAETKTGSCELTLAADVKGAKELMYEHNYDLVILDLVLPEDEDDKHPKAENGIELLDDIYENPNINEPVHIIGLTEVAGLKPQYEERFHKHLNHLIDYQAESYNWKDQLKNFIWRLLEKEEKFESNRLQNSGYDYDIAIITALDKELDAIKKLPVSWTKVSSIDSDKTTYFETEFKGKTKTLRVVAASTPQMGMSSAAVLSMKLIHNFRPKYIIMTGIMAAFNDPKNEKFGFGDIIVSDECWDGGAGKISEDEKGSQIFKAGAKHLSLNADIKELVRAYQSDTALFNNIREKSELKPKTVLDLHVGPTASVAGVIENNEVINQLKSHDRKLLGLEMETYGVFFAANNCSNPKPIPISIKSVSDFADKSKNDQYQHYASYTSAAFMYHFALNEL